MCFLFIIVGEFNFLQFFCNIISLKVQQWNWVLKHRREEAVGQLVFLAILWFQCANVIRPLADTEVLKASPSTSQPPLLLVCSSPAPSEERLRGELGLLLLKREAGGGPRALRQHRLSLSHLLCESAGCCVLPWLVWPRDRCDAECCHSFIIVSSEIVIHYTEVHESVAWDDFNNICEVWKRRRTDRK